MSGGGTASGNMGDMEVVEEGGSIPRPIPRGVEGGSEGNTGGYVGPYGYRGGGAEGKGSIGTETGNWRR